MKIRETSNHAKNAAAAFAAMAKEYDAWFEDNQVFDLELAALDLLGPELDRPIIEVGCGTGRFSAATGVDFGIDPARKCLGIARQRGVKTICARAETLPFPDSWAGSVMFFFSLCFCADQRRSIAEGVRVLRPGGTMVTAIINGDSPRGKEVDKKRAAGHPLYRFADLLTPGRLLAMLEDSGLEVTGSVSCLKSSPGNPAPGEKPAPGIDPDAGCCIIAARKPYQE